METINLWYKLNLHGRKIIAVFVLFFGLSSTLSGQVRTHMNLPGYDDRQLHYGFQLGLNYTQFKITQSDYFLQQDSVLAVRGTGSPGFTLGFVLNYRLGEFFDLRLLPAVAFYERTVEFKLNQQEEPAVGTFESSVIELPLLVKYKSFRRVNNRMYMVAGIKPGIEVGGRKNQKENDNLAIKSFDLSAEIGFGTDVYFPLFKFAPELRFSVGLLDLYQQKDNVLSRTIRSQSTYTVALYLMFE